MGGGVGQEGVVRDPDSAETCRSQKLSDLPVGLGGWNGTDSLFPLGVKSVLFLQQVKAKVFECLGKSGPLSKKLCILPPIKEREGGESLPYSPSELVQPAGGHLHTRSVQPCWLVEKVLRSDAKVVLKIVGEFLKSCGNKVQVICAFLHYWDFPTGRQQWAGSVGPGRCRTMYLSDLGR
jgi:hypothetical protein